MPHRYLVRAQTEGRHWLMKRLGGMDDLESFAGRVINLCPEAKVSILDLATGEGCTYYPRPHTDKGPYTGPRFVQFV